MPHGDVGSKLNVALTIVDFSPTSGKWYIEGNVCATGKRSVFIKSETDFGTFWDAMSACQHVANDFEDAVSHVVVKVLTNKEMTAV